MGVGVRTNLPLRSCCDSLEIVWPSLFLTGWCIVVWWLLGGCPKANRVYQYSVANATVDAVCPMDPKTNELTLNLGPMSPNYRCVGKRLHSANTWMGIVGVAVMAILMAKKVKGAIMMGILFVTVISWIPGHLASYLGEGAEIDGERVGCGVGWIGVLGRCQEFEMNAGSDLDGGGGGWG